MNQKEWLGRAKEITKVYHENEKQIADKGRLLQVLEAFEALYKVKEPDTPISLFNNGDPKSAYLKNLVFTGVMEGSLEESRGTVESQIKQTIEFIKNSKNVYCSQAKGYSENLVTCLEHETFKVDTDTVLRPYWTALNLVASGQY